MNKRSEAYSYIISTFGFLQRLLTIEEQELEIKTNELVKMYPGDLNSNLLDEFRQFIPLIKDQPENRLTYSKNILAPLKVLDWMVNFDMQQIFPNIFVALRILLTIPIANCETERSFSVLKRIKSMYRSTMNDYRLSSLARLSIESELLRSLNFDDVINEFAESKSRKKYF